MPAVYCYKITTTTHAHSAARLGPSEDVVRLFVPAHGPSIPQFLLRKRKMTTDTNKMQKGKKTSVPPKALFDPDRQRVGGIKCCRDIHVAMLCCFVRTVKN